MNPLYWKYYDRIYSKKDYAKEANVVLAIAQNLNGKAPRRILDVGCGTGNHAILFAQMGFGVTGVDNDCDAIKVASGKCENVSGSAPLFICGNVGELKEHDFDLAVSLFNVVGYIKNLEGLVRFFKDINERLKNGGVFIFDCWNGIAAILDNPKEKYSKIQVNGERISIATKPDIDLMKQTVSISNDVEVKNISGEKVTFRFQYQQTLWTPWCLENALETAGFETVSISELMKPEMKASYKTWKIMLLCKKKS